MSVPAISQVTDIKLGNNKYDPVKQTLELDSLSINNVDRGLRNEERQRVRIKELEDALRSKDSIINELKKENKQIVENLSDKLDETVIESRKAIEAANQLYENEKNKDKNGFYLGADYTTSPLNTVFGKFSWVRSKMILDIGAGKSNIPDIDNTIVYKIGVSFFLF